MGVRFAAAGGRSGWVRTLLTAVGIGFGVAVLLLAGSIPTALQAADARTNARTHQVNFTSDGEDATPRGPHTILVTRLDTQYRDKGVLGWALQPEGDPAEAVRPPGVAELPGPGEMVVSPALRELLKSSEGKLLKERFEGTRIAGTVSPEGLKGPGELVFYQGSDQLRHNDTTVVRVPGFGVQGAKTPLEPALVVLLIVMLAVLLMPVVVFIATAVRFGGERRDRRLAALRLVGADAAMTRRIASGEVLFGAVLGLLLGLGLFLTARLFADDVEISQISLYPHDIVPVWWLGALVMLLVPVTAVLVTLAALRGVSIGPLGVFREGTTRRRRVWWRLALLAVGVAMLLYFGPNVGGGDVNEWAIATGVLLMLGGITALLPWAVERAVTWLHGGPLSWQLAIRRLQLHSGMAARAVSGVTVAVAGAVALHMLFSAVETQELNVTGEDTSRAQAVIYAEVDSARQAREERDRYARAEGVTALTGYVRGSAVLEGGENTNGMPEYVAVQVADCAELRQLARTGSCADGDVFLAEDSENIPEDIAVPEPANRVNLGTDAEPRWWTIPETARQVEGLRDPQGLYVSGVLATPGALEVSRMEDAVWVGFAQTEPGNADAIEHLRNLAGLGPWGGVQTLSNTQFTSQFVTVRKGLFAGAAVIMLVIAASMIVSTLEQLRERKRQLSVLVAFGTRRGTLGSSVLWQTAVPVGIGLALASAGGTGLGLLLVNMIDAEVTDWLAFVPLAGAGLGMIALVTLASLPMLWHLMRPDGLRTE
ncbi:ABC transporter permease [Streptomyces sp. JJ66]|nr:ABC transporter permease [Streptomyces sp. JJ66]